MSQRTLHLRQAVLGGLAVSLVLTVVSTLQSPPGGRVAAFVLTATSCALGVALVLVAVTSVQARRRR